MNRFTIKDPEPITSPRDCAKYFSRFKGARQEHFMVLTLNGAHVPIHMYVISMGLMNRTVVHPREVFYPAIKDNAACIIIAHNHPSGHVTPSPEDRDITKRLKEAGEVLGISVLDHLIIAKNNTCSLLEDGEF